MYDCRVLPIALRGQIKFFELNLPKWSNCKWFFQETSPWFHFQFKSNIPMCCLFLFICFIDMNLKFGLTWRELDYELMTKNWTELDYNWTKVDWI